MRWLSDFEARKARVAVELARKAIADTPDRPGAWLALGRALISLGEFQDAAARLREAIATLPPSDELLILLVHALFAQDLFEEAVPHAEAALAMDPSDARARRLYFDVLTSSKCWDRTGLDAADVAAFSPFNTRLMEMRTKSLGPLSTVEMCDALLAANPAHTNARYLKALNLAKLGRAAEARELIALDRLIEICDLPVPRSYDDERSFRDALMREIHANPTLASDPRGKATRDGLQTKRLRQPEAIAVEDLLDLIRQAVDAYERRLVASGDEFARGRPAKARLNAWAVVYGRDGRQISHRHPGGWLSGVYYVAAPRLGGENAYRGRLLVGALDPKEHGVDPPWGTREIEPVPGRLVMFPSYVPHATEATGIDGARISVAFDVVPF